MVGHAAMNLRKVRGSHPTPHERENPGFAGVFYGVRVKLASDPDGIRTRVAALKGPCPRPLDDGAKRSAGQKPRLGERDNMQMFLEASMVRRPCGPGAIAGEWNDLPDHPL